MSKITLILFCLIFGTSKLAVSDPQNDPTLGFQPESGGEALDERGGMRQNRNFNGNVPRQLPMSLMPGGQPVPVPGGQPVPVPINPSGRVECFACVDCPSVSPSTPVKYCPYNPDSAKQNKCVVFAESYKHMAYPIFIRGCASERGTCAEMRKSHSNHDNVELTYCKECVGDACNTSGASRFIFDHTMAFFVIVITPLLGKYTLS